MKIEAKICEMAQAELLQIIPASEYARIKEQDARPEFRAYAIAHEGESKGRMAVDGASLGQVVKRWARTAIERIHAKLAMGTPIFHLHGNPSNEHSGRQPIGEVVGRALREIGGRLHAIAVAYIKPEHRTTPLDIASIEADVVYQGETNDVDVRDVTGIALGSSSVTRPGFAGARLLAAIQEFAEQHTGGNKPMTAAEIKAAIKEAGLTLSDLFTVSQIHADPVVVEHVRDKTAGEYAHRKRTEDDLAKLKDTLTTEHKKQVDALTAENTQLRTTTLKIQAKDKLPNLIKARKLDATQEKFVLAKLDTFNPTAADKLETELNAYLDERIKEFDATAELLGIKKKANEPGVPPQGYTGNDNGDLDALRKELIPGL